MEKIIVDTREKNFHLVEELESLGIEVEIKPLKVGDYIVKDVVIERKTISDFINSMLSRRLLIQIEELIQYPNRLLIIEGFEEQELYPDESLIINGKGIHPNSIRGFLLSILLKYKVPIIFTKDYKDTAKFFSVILKRKTQEMSLNANKKTLNSKERKEFILEGFPGIGPKTSKKLLENFGTLKEFINAPEEDLKKILGKKTEGIKKIIEGEYKEGLYKKD
ncbi:hypothetical protein K0A97_02515 [Patescibacteria group bacterium]|nr:hypothetical protein [Patescibacteria group bacterium]